MASAPSLPVLMRALLQSWTRDTSFTPREWSPQNPARGQCLVTSLVIQDYYGGDLRRYAVEGVEMTETHYCNVLEGDAIFDATAVQYASMTVSLTPTAVNLHGYSSSRERYLADPATRQQYELLRSRVAAAIGRLN